MTNQELGAAAIFGFMEGIVFTAAVTNGPQWLAIIVIALIAPMLWLAHHPGRESA